MTADAKDLINRMLTVDPAKRITGIEAIHHPWIAQGETVASHQDRLATIDRLRTFNSARRKFKAAVIAIQLAHMNFGESSEEPEEI